MTPRTLLRPRTQDPQREPGPATVQDLLRVVTWPAIQSMLIFLALSGLILTVMAVFLTNGEGRTVHTLLAWRMPLMMGTFFLTFGDWSRIELLLRGGVARSRAYICLLVTCAGSALATMPYPLVSIAANRWTAADHADSWTTTPTGAFLLAWLTTLLTCTLTTSLFLAAWNRWGGGVILAAAVIGIASAWVTHMDSADPGVPASVVGLLLPSLEILLDPLPDGTGGIVWALVLAPALLWATLRTWEPRH